MRDRLDQALRAANVDYADIRIEDVTTTWINFRGEELDSIGSARTLGGIARALYKGGWGYAIFNDVNGMDQRVREACEAARLVGQETSCLAPVEPVVDEMKATLSKDFRDIPLAEKKSLVEEYKKIVMGHSPKIQSAWIGYADSFKKIWFATSEGTYIADEQPDVWVAAQATARDGENVQNNFESSGGWEGYQLVENFHPVAERVARRAVELLSASPVTGGTYPVVIDPLLAGVFAHEAFGHLSESDFIYENPQMKELMMVGKRFGSENLNILDHGALSGGLGAHRYDFEGVPTRKNYLIKDGILVGRLHSRETAGKMGETPTGNARSVGYQYPPIVRMTNTYIDRGSATFDDLIRDIPLGVYAINAIGGQTAIEMFTFSAAYAYMIRDGQVAELVRDVTLAGNVFETLKNIDLIENNLQWHPGGPGGCGKNGQNGLRVGLGGPHVRIQNVVVGGRQ